MRRLIIVISVLVIFAAIGVLFLNAEPQRIGNGQDVSQVRLSAISTPTSVPANVIETSNISAAATGTMHTIDAAGATPTLIVQGANQPVIFTADISDPAVNSSSLTLIEVNSNGSQVVLGSMQSQGDGVWTLQQHFAFEPTGTLSFFISAAFVGSLKRIQTPTFTVTIAPSETLPAGTSVASGGFFTIKLPPELNIADDPSSGGYDTHTYDVTLSDGTIVAWIYVYTHAQWAALQQLNTDAELPVLASTGVNWTCAYAISENDGNAVGIPEGTVLSDVSQALSTITAN